jgi:hypothetical protein
MKTIQEIVPVEIFSGISWEAEMIKNILENEGIESFLNDEITGTLVPFYTSQGMGSVKVVVSNLDYDKAKLIVAEFRKNQENK